MSHLDNSFGFIDYYVRGVRTRICVQFFDSKLGPIALLCTPTIGDRQDNLLVMVDDDMAPLKLGDFEAVLGKYPDEFRSLTAQADFAENFLAGHLSLLAMFKLMHFMQSRSLPIQQAAAAIAQHHAMLLENRENIAADMKAFLERYSGVEAARARVVLAPDASAGALQIVATT